MNIDQAKRKRILSKSCMINYNESEQRRILIKICYLLKAACSNLGYVLAAFLSTISSSIVGIVDIQVSGLLGSTTQAAVGLSEQILFLFMILIMSTGVGTTAIVSQAFGARDTKRVIEATAQSLSLGLLIGVALALLAWLTARLLLPLFSHAPSVIHQGQIYLSIFALYLIPFSIICIFNAALRAIGDARTPLIVIICTTCLNVVGDYLTVAGNWQLLI